MESTQSPLQFLVENSADFAIDTAPGGTVINYDDVARSENNILKWMAYLPDDCIKTMIDMGWDVTT